MLGIRIRELRKEKGETQDKLANELNVTRLTLRYYEMEKRAPDINVCIKIADHFGVSLDYLCGLSPNRNRNITQEIDTFRTNFLSIKLTISPFCFNMIFSLL